MKTIFSYLDVQITYIFRIVKISECSTGYFKCPKSYCIPLYQVNDGVNDCSRGEDENVIFKTNSPHYWKYDLKHLNLSYTKVSSFDEFRIPGNFKLKSLDIRGIEIKEIHRNYFHGLSISEMLLASDYRLCCEVILGDNIYSDICQAPSDAISTCNHIVGDTLKRVIIWIVGLLTVGGNGLVLIYRLVWKKENIFKAHILFVIGLAVSDFIMGVYLLIIASADIYYTNEYVLNESIWRHGALCQFAGFLSTLSSETSTFFICWITFDRFIVVKFPFDENITSTKGKYVAFISSWILGFLLALIPAVHPDWEIYSSNGMCLALPLSTREFKGWEYSFAIFVVLNFVLFLFIAVGQVAIFSSIVKTRRRLSCTKLNEVDNRQETALAKKLALVALTDFLCWFPIGIMGMLSVGGQRYSSDVYAWVAIFILPINSAVNPMLYTIPELYKKFEKSVRLSYQSSLKRSSETVVLENMKSP
ncbi:hypothetical protein Btru_078099 [Bulinus truncatus]|nr:hypothetical protein Btru_078099 [Bulinus truncatus]